ncbi:MAG: glycosyltransferase [Anderseniella sp.]|nr:glycosyltransferase [Anderseniella sp.]
MRDVPPTSATVYLVEERPNPSTDYFVLPALRAAGCRIERCGFADLPVRERLAGAVVVLVRYVPAAWARLIESARKDMSGLVFFMDDDVLDWRASTGMPWRYRIKLARLAAWRRTWLQRQKAELWVSTPWLTEKYAGWQPRLVEPVPLAALTGTCRVFYHGSASHGSEIRWLKSVVSGVLERDKGVVFEIIGGRDVWRLYRDLPRVNVIHPMKWPAYQAFLAMPGRHVGLAPLLDQPFNRARSCTKFFDITSCGAAGIYASSGACADWVEDGVSGLLVPMDGEAWTDAILRLASDAPLRQRLVQGAQARLARFSGSVAE